MHTKNNRLVDANQFKNLLVRLLQILEVVHGAKIVHRDIKPQNILLRSNNEWVLGDFGIAWFDREIHKKVAKTEGNERLANWEFSAPEQIRRNAYIQPKPSMDLYALGQTLYYCVTGQVIRGTEYPRFSQVAPALSQYDALIEKLVRHEPPDRFRSVQDVRQFIKEQQASREQDEYIRRYRRRMERFVREQGVFDTALRRAIPGVLSYAQAKNREEINRVLSSLAEHCEACNLWWFAGYSANSACPIEKLSEEIWLIDDMECKIIDLWIYRHPTYERQYVLAHMTSQTSFFY